MPGGSASSVQSPGIAQFPPIFGNTNAALGAGTTNTLDPKYNMFGQNLGAYNFLTQELMNNPYASLAQLGANTAGGMATNAANNAFGTGGALTHMGIDVLPGYAGQVMGTAFDPQSQLYNYLQQQNTQQSRANEAAAGVAATPYGAGLADQSNQQFNMNWQNQQLQRQLAGLQGATGAIGTGANLAGLGTQLQAQAPGQYMQGAGLPYGMFGNIIQNQLGGLQGLGQYGQQAAQIPQQQIQDWGSLVQLAQAGDQNAIQIMRNQLLQNQQNWNQLGGLGQGIGSLFGSTGMFGPQGAFGGLFP